MSEEIYEAEIVEAVPMDDDFDPAMELQFLQQQEQLLTDALAAHDLEDQVGITIDPVFMALDIRITAFGLAKLLGLAE